MGKEKGTRGIMHDGKKIVVTDKVLFGSIWPIVYSKVTISTLALMFHINFTIFFNFVKSPEIIM